MEFGTQSGRCERELTVFPGGGFSVCGKADESWTFAGGTILINGKEVPFSDAEESTFSLKTGLGKGTRTRYRFANGITFETRIWIDGAGDLYTQWIPLSVPADRSIEKVCWPGSADFDTVMEGYSLLPLQQGLLIPNGWPVELSRLPFDGQLCSAAAYMPWFGQVKARPNGEGNGYIAIHLSPADAGYICAHPAGGSTALSFYRLPSLGKTEAYTIRYSFRERCDYNFLAKIYRQYARETGLLRTLREKAAANLLIEDLIGAGFVHTGIKTHVAPDSDFFDPSDPEKNNRMTPFSERAEELRRYHALGVDRLYLHLDGWAEPGYDNAHPDYLPACEAAGGWEGLRALAGTARACGYLFGLHDQYRDYYHAAPSYDPSFSAADADGNTYRMARWAGGPQDYLCASQAVQFVRRNFSVLFSEKIHPDGSYLDVFTCNEPDECFNPAHPMTRTDCLRHRLSAFSWLNAQGILPSSEEAADWAIPQLVFCHYAPYEFMLTQPGTPRRGLPVPLFNLVYHDCLIIPWPMERMQGEDYMLYALLNAGAAYIRRDPAYMGIDGAFGQETQDEEAVARWKTVSALQRKAAKMEMVSHRFSGGISAPDRQQTVFSDGKRTITVTADFSSGYWTVGEAENDG